MSDLKRLNNKKVISMKKILYKFLLFGVLGLTVSCTDYLNSLKHNPENGSLDDGVQISLRFPEMQQPGTKSLGETDADYMSKLHLYLFVFDGSTLSQTLHIYPSETEWADVANPGDSHETTNKTVGNRHLWFKTPLPQTDNPAIIHIVALDDTDGKFAEKVRKLGYGLEDIVMPSLSVSNDQDAYWQRIELGCQIKKTITSSGEGSEVLVEGTEDKLAEIFSNPIPLIRNFAKIVVKNSVPGMKFDILGWTVVNDLDGGTVAPFYSTPNSSDVQFPIFADWSKNPADIYSYDELNRQGYPGASLSGASFRKTIDDVGGYDSAAGDNLTDIWTTDPKYLYERKYATVNPLYILIYGRYNGNTTTKTGYYKLNLGERNEETGLMTDYSVIRNIMYTVNITDVSFEGYASPAEAANAPASNNISGDVVTKDMFSITDGLDMLYVNQINFIITQPNHTVDFRYRYVTDITDTHAERNDLVEYDFYYSEDDTRVGLPNDAHSRSSEVVKSWSNPVDVRDEINRNAYWKSINIDIQNPTDELKQESFIVFSKPVNGGTQGLSRKINLILRNPWDFLRVAVYPGQWDDDSQFPDFDPDKDEYGNPYVGAEQGAKLTLFMELPAGLPEAMFPLDFTIESDRQNIQNDGAGNAAVEKGQSLWPDVVDNRIQYVKTVAWRDYAPNGETSTASSRVVRMRLNTTTSLENVDINKMVSTIRIFNPYFNLTDTKFVREINATHIWDFSQEEWVNIVEYLRDNTSPRTYSTTINGLTVANGNSTSVLKAGSDDNGTYISMGNTNNSMKFSALYATSESPREGILRITAEGATVSLTCTGTGVTATAQNGTAFNSYETKEWKVAIQANTATTASFTIKTSANNTILKIYKIEWYPLGDSE